MNKTKEIKPRLVKFEILDSSVACADLEIHDGLTINNILSVELSPGSKRKILFNQSIEQSFWLKRIDRKRFARPSATLPAWLAKEATALFEEKMGAEIQKRLDKQHRRQSEKSSSSEIEYVSPADGILGKSEKKVTVDES